MSFPSLVLLTLVLLTRPEAYAVAYKMDPGRGRGINPNKVRVGEDSGERDSATIEVEEEHCKY